MAYGDAGNDELTAGENTVELHGDSGDDMLVARDIGDKLFGEGDDDTLVGGSGQLSSLAVKE